MDKKEEKERKMEEGNNRGGNEQKREREKKKKVFRFSLISTEIGPWVFVRARSKVGPRNKGCAWVPKSKGFVKLQEVGNFPTLIIF